MGFDTAAGCAFSLILVVLGVILLAGEGAARGKGRAARIGSGARGRCALDPSGAAPCRCSGRERVVVLALGVPVGAIVYLIIEGGRPPFPSASIWAPR